MVVPKDASDDSSSDINQTLPRWRRAALFKQLGPGLITGAADDDPSGIATYSQAGAQFGYNMLWSMLFTFPLMTAIQLVSGRIGRVTGKGLAANLCEIIPRWALLSLVGLLLIANTINMGANLSAMGAAASLVTNGSPVVFTLAFGVLSLGLQLFITYETYARYLKWLTLVLLAYVAVLFVANVDWWAALKGFFWPNFPLQGESLTMIVAIFGTTISPYLLFWQSSQEVEEIDNSEDEQPLRKNPAEAKKELKRIRIDTFAGMAVSNIVAIAIIMSTAATLHAAGKTEVNSAAEVAEALKPLAGDFAFLIFSLGIIGTGLLSLPVLAGSVAYAFGESQGWKCGLANKPWEAIGFYGVIALAFLVGVAIAISSIDPIAALFWSAVVNCIVAVPIMAAMMIVASRRDEMGKFTIGFATRLFGWIATVAMAAAAVAMFVFW